jgi:hypothetical protein
MPAAPRSPAITRVCVEATAKRAFASALDWPGWCRSGRDEAAAIDALAAYAARYAPVAKEAGTSFATGATLTVIERVPGNATTDFGAPNTAAVAEEEPLTAAEAKRLAALLAATWTVFDSVVQAAPTSLRKGPRGGGRDRDKIADHVLAAEREYARKLGFRATAPHVGEVAQIAAMRDGILATVLAARAGDPPADRAWLPRYAVRRMAWHVMDHAWEIEDRTER